MASSDRSRRALIAGGGLGGLTAALALMRAGCDVTVFEQAEALAEVGAGISLWPNATRVLADLGLLEAVLAAGDRVERVVIRTQGGHRLTQMTAPSAFEVPAVCISRTALHDVLREALPPGVLRLGHRVEGYKQHPGCVTAYVGRAEAKAGDFLVGCDGLQSVVRTSRFGEAAPRYHGYVAWRGMVSFDLPTYAPGVATESWGRGQRFGIFRTGGGQVYWYATAQEPADQDDAPEGAKDKLLRLFEMWHTPIPALLSATPASAILKHGIYDRPPRRSWSDHRVTLLGDAAHPMAPNLGQGACTAIEDAAALARHITATDDIPVALAAYARERYRRTAPLVRRSRQVGQIGQWANPVAVGLRNALLWFTPRALGNLSQERVYGYRVASGKAGGR